MTDLESRLKRAEQFARKLAQIEKLSNDIFDIAAHEENAGNEADAADMYHAGEQLRKLVQDLDHHTTN